jgi:DNA-binding NarL/FixJ family response regulator
MDWPTHGDRRVMSLRCLVVDDNLGFLQAASKVLSSGGVRVVGTASTSAEALLRARETDPDVALVDIALGSESGFDLARKLARGRDAPEIIMISTHDEEDFADLIAESPAIGFLPKWKLSVAAMNDLLSNRGDGEEHGW